MRYWDLVSTHHLTNQPHACLPYRKGSQRCGHFGVGILASAHETQLGRSEGRAYSARGRSRQAAALVSKPTERGLTNLTLHLETTWTPKDPDFFVLPSYPFFGSKAEKIGVLWGSRCTSNPDDNFGSLEVPGPVCQP